MERLLNATHDQHDRLRTHLQNILEISNGHSAVARAEKKYRLEPNMHEHMARFEHRSDLDGERFATFVALIRADPRTRPIQFACSPRASTARTDRALRPNALLDKLIGFFLTLETRIRN
jgi:hypothetical protein